MAYDGRRDKIFGLTHTLTGKPIVRHVRMMKIGFGYAKGKAVHVFINAQRKWIVEVGVGKDKKQFPCDSKTEAQKIYREQIKNAPERGYPGKFPYFTFQRIGIDGDYAPDFDAIERHGALPTRVLIGFESDYPSELSMQMWASGKGLLCEGDGIDARRKLEMASAPHEKTLAEESARKGERFFPIIGGCHSRGCPYSSGDKPKCKPHSRLMFHLAYAPTIGGTCIFDSTGWESARNMTACLRALRNVTGRGEVDADGEPIGPLAGIQVELVLHPYKTQKGPQFAIAMEMRAEDIRQLYKNAIGRAEEFRQLIANPLMIEAGNEPEDPPQELTEAAEERAMTAEFYVDNDGGDFEEMQDDNEEPKQQQGGPKRKSEQRQVATDPVNERWAEEEKKFRLLNNNGKNQAFAQLKKDFEEQAGDTFEFSRVLGSEGAGDKERYKAMLADTEEAVKVYKAAWYALVHLLNALKEPQDA